MSYGGYSHGQAADRTTEALRAHQPFRRSGYNMTGEEGMRLMDLGMLPADWQAVYRNDRPVYTVLSYRTPIAWVARNGNLVIPDVKYSPTTTQHQWTVKAAWGLM